LLEEQVGAGGMAVVYRGRDEVLGRLVAVKVLSPKLAADQDFRARFLRESRAIAAVDEPHVLPVYVAGDAGGVLYIATRFVAGGDLATVLQAGNGPLAPERVASLVEQVSAALDAAHAIGLVHRDVKPANVLIESMTGRAEHAYLSDFGLTKASSGATGLTATGMFMGTPDYCAPEQILGGQVDGRADQYALACVAFNLLTGAVPFQRGDTLATLFAHVKDPVPAATAIRHDLPYPVDAVLARGMAKEPGQRYASCGEFAAALRGALVAAAPPPAYTPTQVAQPPVSPAVGTPFPAWTAGQPQAPVGPQPPAGAPAPAAWAAPPAWGPPGTPAPGSVPPVAPGYPAGGTPPGNFVPGGTAPGNFVPGGTPPGNFVPGGAGAYPDAQAPYPYAGYPPGPYPGPQGTGGKGKRKAAIIAGVAGAAVLVLGGIGVAAALSGGKPKPPLPPPPPRVVLSGATKVATLTSPVGGTMAYALFSPDGTLVAAPGGTDHKANIYVYNAKTGKYLITITMPKGGQAYPLGFTPSEKWLIAVDGATDSKGNRTLYEFDVRTGKIVGQAQEPGSTYAVNDDGSVEANETRNAKFIDVYDLTSGSNSPKYHWPNPTTASTVPYSLYVSSDGSRMLISDVTGKTYVMDVPTGQTLATFSYHYDPNARQLPTLSPDGKTVYAPSAANAPSQLWNVDSRSNDTPHNKLWPQKNGWVIYSTDGQVVATSVAGAPSTDLWNVSLGSHMTTVTIPGSGDWLVAAIGPSGTEALFGSNPVNKDQDVRQFYLYSVP
jgi:serine/threonine-protein kinase